MKLIKLSILGLMMIPVVNAQADAVFFSPAFDTIIILIIVVFIFIGVIKILKKIK